MAVTPKPKPKSAEEQAQESLKRLAMFAGGAIVVLSLFASCLGKRHRVEKKEDIPVSVPAAEAPPAESAPANEPQDLEPLPLPPPVAAASAGDVAAPAPVSSGSGPPPMGGVTEEGMTKSLVPMPGVVNPGPTR